MITDFSLYFPLNTSYSLKFNPPTSRRTYPTLVITSLQTTHPLISPVLVSSELQPCSPSICLGCLGVGLDFETLLYPTPSYISTTLPTDLPLPPTLLTPNFYFLYFYHSLSHSASNLRITVSYYLVYKYNHKPVDSSLMHSIPIPSSLAGRHH